VVAYVWFEVSDELTHARVSRDVDLDGLDSSEVRTLAENAYGPAHDSAVDLAIVQRALADYRGETVVIGDALADALAALDDDWDGGASGAAARS